MTDYSGLTAQIPIGTMGLLSDIAPASMPHNALIKVINCDYGLGFIQKAPGAITYNRSALSAGVVALLDYFPTRYKQRLIAATSDGKIWRDTGDRFFSGGNGTVATAVTTGLGALTPATQFVVGGNETAGRDKKIFLFTGGLNQIKVCAGDNTTFASIASPAADWPNPTASSNPQSFFPKFGLIHRGCLWAFAGSQAYKSNSADHEDFTTSNAVLVSNVGPGEGGDIVGAYVYKQKLIVWKEGDLVYLLNDSDTDSANWYFSKFGEGLGIAGWHSLCQVIDDLIVGNITNTLTSFKVTQQYGDFNQGDMFKENRVRRFFRENTTPMGNVNQQAIFYPDTGLALFTARTMGRQNNDCVIQMDVSDTNSSPKFGIWNHISPDCFALRRDTNNIMRPIYGASDGYIYLMDREDRAVGPMGSGSAYTGEFRTIDLDMRHLDPGLAHKNKHWEWLGVTFQEEGNYNLSVEVWIDGRQSETIQFAQTIDTNYAGAFVTGTSVTGGLDEKTIWKPLHGQGRRINFRCYNSGNNQNFKVSMLTVGFKPSGEQATRLS